MEWEWNRSRDGMGMEWQGGPTGLDPSHLPTLSMGRCNRLTHQRQLWAATAP